MARRPGPRAQQRDDTPSHDPAANTHIYTVDFSAATNILAGSYDDEATSPTLEQQYLPTTDGTVPDDPAGLTPGANSLCVDVNAALGAAGLKNVKLEGAALVGPAAHRLLAVINDNDFDLEHQTDPTGSPDSLPTKLDLVPLPGTC